jgi:hypothetical protein
MVLLLVTQHHLGDLHQSRAEKYNTVLFPNEGFHALMILCSVNEILITSLVFTFYSGINAVRESPYDDNTFLNNDLRWIKWHISKDAHPYYEVYIMPALKNLKEHIIYSQN